MGAGMSEEQVRAFVQYFFDALAPAAYYDRLVQSQPPYLAIVFTLDFGRNMLDYKPLV